jgi:hypothetical protein
MRDVDRGRIVKTSTRTVSQFLTEWLAAVEPTFDPTTWRYWSDCARWYVVPQIGAEPLQRLDEPQLLRLYAKLLSEGRVKRDNDTVMFRYWSERTEAGAIEVRDLAAQIIDPFGRCDRAGEHGAFDLFYVGFEVSDDRGVALDHLVQDRPENRVSAQCKQFGVLLEPRPCAV